MADLKRVIPAGVGEGAFITHRKHGPPQATTATPRPKARPRRGPCSEVRVFEKAVRCRIREVVGDTTPYEIAERTGLDPEEVLQCVGKGPPSVYFLVRLCEAFGASVDWMFAMPVHRPRRPGPRQVVL